MKTLELILIIGLSILGPVIFIICCIILVCLLLKKRKTKVRPHISVATKSAAPDNYPPLPQPQQQQHNHHQHPSASPPPRPPPPPHMINGGVYRAHDVTVSSPAYPADSSPYHSPPYPCNPPSYGPNPPRTYTELQNPTESLLLSASKKDRITENGELRPVKDPRIVPPLKIKLNGHKTVEKIEESELSTSMALSTQNHQEKQRRRHKKTSKKPPIPADDEEFIGEENIPPSDMVHNQQLQQPRLISMTSIPQMLSPPKKKPEPSQLTETVAEMDDRVSNTNPHDNQNTLCNSSTQEYLMETVDNHINSNEASNVYNHVFDDPAYQNHLADEVLQEFMEPVCQKCGAPVNEHGLYGAPVDEQDLYGASGILQTFENVQGTHESTTMTNDNALACYDDSSAVVPLNIQANMQMNVPAVNTPSFGDIDSSLLKVTNDKTKNNLTLTAKLMDSDKEQMIVNCEFDQGFCFIRFPIPKCKLPNIDQMVIHNEQQIAQHYAAMDPPTMVTLEALQQATRDQCDEQKQSQLRLFESVMGFVNKVSEKAV